ncbi:hypothetical protein RRG08_035570, partial [Elysia crispata]
NFGTKEQCLVSSTIMDIVLMKEQVTSAAWRSDMSWATKINLLIDQTEAAISSPEIASFLQL